MLTITENFTFRLKERKLCENSFQETKILGLFYLIICELTPPPEIAQKIKSKN